ncbi:MAG: DUF2782 domain-containing protein [Gammaproteobacteria bacterium]|nr:DUF2782 domain-containing protein [Gammaproteobacteria bacterium]MCF6230962.1 DUF2782 domain-containing protein [Gammaproteobacteria bacterium]
MKRLCYGVVFFLFCMPPLWAQDVTAQQQAIDSAEQALEPKVTIHEDGRGLVEEYRLNGSLYMIKITPKVGHPYYLIDADGDGELESRRNELDPDVMIPAWMIFRW